MLAFAILYIIKLFKNFILPPILLDDMQISLECQQLGIVIVVPGMIVYSFFNVLNRMNLKHALPYTAENPSIYSGIN